MCFGIELTRLEFWSFGRLFPANCLVWMWVEVPWSSLFMVCKAKFLSKNTEIFADEELTDKGAFKSSVRHWSSYSILLVRYQIERAKHGWDICLKCVFAKILRSGCERRSNLYITTVIHHQCFLWLHTRKITLQLWQPSSLISKRTSASPSETSVVMSNPKVISNPHPSTPKYLKYRLRNCGFIAPKIELSLTTDSISRITNQLCYHITQDVRDW